MSGPSISTDLSSTIVAETQPLMVILGWAWAKHDVVSKYTELYKRLGCDVLAYYPQMLSLWLPRRATQHAQEVIDLISKDIQVNGQRPLLFAVFSGAAKACYYKLLQMLSSSNCSAEEQARNRAILSCCMGQIFDSSPVDFTSDVGVKLFNMNSRGISGTLIREASTLAAGTLDFFLLERFEKERQQMWDTLAHSPIKGPVLFLYSLDDHLADAAKIRELAVSLRAKGRQVIEQVWPQSPHVGHLKQHPQQYREAVQHYLQLALQQHSSRTSPAPAGPPAAAGSLQRVHASARCSTLTMSWPGLAAAGALPVTLHRRTSSATSSSAAGAAGLTTHRRTCAVDSSSGATAACITTHQPVRCTTAGSSASDAGLVLEQQVWAPAAVAAVVEPAAVGAVFRAEQKSEGVEGFRVGGQVFVGSDEAGSDLCAAGQQVLRLQLRSRL